MKKKRNLINNKAVHNACMQKQSPRILSSSRQISLFDINIFKRRRLGVPVSKGNIYKNTFKQTPYI